jgi:hypothetical protein
MEFQKDISRDEDIAYQTENKHSKFMKILTHLLQRPGQSSIPLDLLAKNELQGLLGWISTLSTPGGLFHISLMFGPLMIENGVGYVNSNRWFRNSTDYIQF